MLRLGDVIETSYGTGLYRIIRITRNCKCPDYLTGLNCDRTPCGHEEDCLHNCPLTKDQDPHMHLVCVDAGEPIRDHYPDHKLSYLNGYREYPDGTIRSVWNPSDHLVVVGHQKVQPSFLDWMSQEEVSKEV